MTAVVAAAALISLAFPAGRHQWALSFVRQPTPFTTLLFNHAAQLPRSLPAGESMPLSFTVVNDEGHQLRYSYLVTSTDGRDVRSVLRRGTISVPAAARGSVTVRVTPVCNIAPCRVEVSLPGHPETIDALLDSIAPAR